MGSAEPADPKAAPAPATPRLRSRRRRRRAARPGRDHDLAQRGQADLARRPRQGRRRRHAAGARRQVDELLHTERLRLVPRCARRRVHRSRRVGASRRRGGRRASSACRPGSPADGILRTGDAITAVAGQPVATKSIADVVAALRGEVGTTVTVSYRRAAVVAHRHAAAHRRPHPRCDREGHRLSHDHQGQRVQRRRGVEGGLVRRHGARADTSAASSSTCVAIRAGCSTRACAPRRCFSTAGRS